MLKIILIPVMAVAAFLGAILVPLAINGKLNLDTVKRIRGVETEIQNAPRAVDDAGPLAQALQEERARLEEWERDLQEEQDRIEQRQRVLDETLSEIIDLQALVQAGLDELDTKQSDGVNEVAKTMAAMDPQNAAMDLQAMTPEDAARLLPLIKDRTRGAILDTMDPDRRATILQIMQERKY